MRLARGRVTRQHLEAALLSGTTLHVVAGLSRTGGYTEGLVLLVLTAAALWQEWLSRPQQPGIRYVCKVADSQGIALGALALPACFASLLSSSTTSGTANSFRAFAFLAVSASSAVCLAFISLGQAQGPSHGLHQKWHSLKAEPLHNHSKLKLLLDRATTTSIAAIVVAVLTVTAAAQAGGSASSKGATRLLYQGKTSKVAGVLLHATASSMALHVLLSRFPRCFTIGEATVVAQTLVLLATDSILILWSLSAGHQSFSSSTLPTLLGRRAQFHIFIELLTSAALCFSCTAALLMQSIPRVRAQLPSQQLRNPGNQGSPTASSTADSSGPSWEADILVNGSRPKVEPLARPRHVGQRQPPEGSLNLRALLTWEALLLLLLVSVAARLAVQPAVWALHFAVASTRRVLVLVYWAVVLAVSLPCMDWLSRASALPTIIVRKGYHILAVLLFAPVLVVEPELLSIGLAIACAALIVMESLRIGGAPRLGPWIHDFMTSFIDERDSGLLLVSHFSLLVGMAGPIWLCSLPVEGSTESSSERSAAFAGIVMLGAADSAASMLGRRFGRRRILGTKKTVEGTAGAIICTLLLWVALSRMIHSKRSMWDLTLATVMSCLLEASTTQLDNIFLPLNHLTWLL